MANIDTLTTKLSAIGDAIREKTGKEETMTLDEMPTEIESISGGGGTVPDTMSDLKFLNINNRIGDVLPKKITFVYPAVRIDPGYLWGYLRECSLNENVEELVIDLSKATGNYQTYNSYISSMAYSFVKYVNTNGHTKITINNPNNYGFLSDSKRKGVLILNNSRSSTTDCFYILKNANDSITLNQDDLNFLKEICKIGGYIEGTSQSWYIGQANYQNMQEKALILGFGLVTNPQFLLDNFQFDTNPSSSPSRGISYHSLVLEYFYKWAPNSTFYNVHIDRGNYITTEDRFFYFNSQGANYNYFCRKVPAADFTWETDENNQPLVLTNIANQTLNLFSGIYGIDSSWTATGIKNFLKTLPDTSQGEGNNTIIGSYITSIPSSSSFREYFENIPEEDVASLTDRGWTLTLS